MKTNQVAERQSLEYYLNLKYPISIIPEEEGGFTALIPDLPGCMTQGETMEEVVANIDEARQLWIETVYSSGKKVIPLPKNKNLWALLQALPSLIGSTHEATLTMKKSDSFPYETDFLHWESAICRVFWAK